MPTLDDLDRYEEFWWRVLGIVNNSPAWTRERLLDWAYARYLRASDRLCTAQGKQPALLVYAG